MAKVKKDMSASHVVSLHLVEEEKCLEVPTELTK